MKSFIYIVLQSADFQTIQNSMKRQSKTMLYEKFSFHNGIRHLDQTNSLPTPHASILVFPKNLET